MAGADMKFEIKKGLAFSSEDEALTLDLYLPLGVTEKTPCILVIQGGGFRPQDGKRFRPFAEDLAQNGFAAALISYRGVPRNNYLDSMSDCKAAVRFVRKVSGDYNIDSDRIGVMGRSAGGTLAILLAVSGGEAELEGKGGHAEYSSRVQAAVGISGVYDFVGRFQDEDQLKIQGNAAKKLESNGVWIGEPFDPQSRLWLQASAIQHLDAGDPPILLLHSKNDNIVPWLQSQDFYRKMQQKAVPGEMIVTDEGGHSGPQNSKELMVTFFEKTLK